MSSTRPDLKFADKVDERLYFRKFTNLPAKDSSTIRIIDHNNKDYFTVLDEDADLVADNIYKTQSVIKYNPNNKNRYVTVSLPVLTNNLLKFCLIEKNLKVEIYNNKTFDLICFATPGNLESLASNYGVDLESLFKDCSTPIIAGIKFHQQGNGKRIGICFVDLLNSSIKLCEFEDNELFSNLESLLLQMGVKEVIFPSNYDPQDDNPEVIKLYQVLLKIGNIVISTIKPSAFSQKDIEADLSKIVVSDLKSDEEVNIDLILASKGINSSDFNLSLSCCNALIEYLELLGEQNQNFTIDQYNLSAYMKLDASTMKALNIFPSTNTANGSSLSKSTNITSIFELLNKCKTAAGSRLLSQWLKQPLTDLDSIEVRQDLVQLLIDDNNLRVFITEDWLSKVPDIKRLFKKILSGTKRTSGNESKKLEDVVRLYQFVLIVPELIEMLEVVVDDLKDNGKLANLVKKNWLEPIKLKYEPLSKFKELVETTTDLSPLDSTSAHDLMNTDFNIKPEFDESLVEINERLQGSLHQIREIHEDVANDLNMEVDKKLKLENHQQHGWCFRVTRIDSTVLRNTGNKYTQLQTVKAGVYFTTKRLSALSQEYLEASAEYNLKQRELVKEILSITLTYQLVFIPLSLTVSEIDVLSSFANVAIFAPIPFVRPISHPMSNSINSDDHNRRKIKLQDSRHPVLEVQDDIDFIPNDLYFSNEKSEKGKSFVIITGPNMGGKSTYIRQAGVIALMNQVGSFIPVGEDNFKPEIAVFDAILSRVGAGDSQLKGLSTFMIEMLETSSILATATHNSLIIIDELGRGTSTYDGFGLAWSILEHLISEKKCFTLFATHFHELTQLSSKYEDQVENLHVVAHVQRDDENEEDDITLMYKVEPGISDKSFGIHVAELVKFPSKIINMAKRKASELQQTVLDEDDKYIQNKKTKCSPSEIQSGIHSLKSILKNWRSQCFDESNSECKVQSSVALDKLKTLVNNEYADTIKNDKFISEIIQML
ncbi:uncharacterized protein PRCAT00002544001 [Priceomyces carsonii]|uniref:uncharacterized protein n=1 Tax=Priceomyces carsonii TaxID=28549 RepID=UPI002ED87728|nr:unnamed protein product [Priceomyces carsonii]